MTISLLLVVMRILTVTTCSKLEMLPVSGAPSAQHTWGRRRLAARLPHRPRAGSQRGAPTHCWAGNASWSHSALREGAGALSEQDHGLSLSPAPPGAQHPAPRTSPEEEDGEDTGCGGRRGERCAGSDRTSERTAQWKAQGAGVIASCRAGS